ncbi:uncharacterized protein LOC141596099 [Silene latifolia]|uniref:uncharacterized protein LOC141596099 n=1 Tax=Silene latifolia TaxID=37657 RepID=UPI003D76CA41
METKSSETQEISSAEAILFGALAPGVNVPTWNTMKFVFVMLGFSLTFMLILGFNSSDLGLILHVGFLVFISFTLFFLLARFLEQTGLVSVEHQMQEIGLRPKDGESNLKID